MNIPEINVEPSAGTKQRRTFAPSLPALCIVVFAAIATARLLILMAGGASVPFWDQWGGENSIFSAFHNGTLTWEAMFAAHNEHRIFWTRLLTIALFEINGKQWDNQVEAALSNLIYCLALLVPLLIASLNQRKIQIFSVALVVLLAGSLPFGWENTLVGFQSQFYINTLLAMLAIATAALSGIGVRTIAVLSLLVLFSFASMANGVLTAFACAAVLVARGVADRRLLRGSLLIAAIALALGVAGYLSTPSPPHHAALKAHDLAELAAASWITSSWPLPPFVGQLVLFLPCPVWMLFAARGQRTSADFFFLGLNALGLLNAAAIAYSRGHDLVEVTSRYTDTILPSCIAASYFAARLISSDRRIPERLFGCASYLLIVSALIAQSVIQLPKLQERAYFLRMSTINTADFLDGNDNAFVKKPHGHVPYPDPARLGESLRERDQTSFLPTSLLGVRALSNHLEGAAGRCYLSSSAKNHFSTISGECKGVHAGDGAVAVATGPLSAALMSARQSLDVSIFPRAAPILLPETNSDLCSLDGFNEGPTSRVPLTSSVDVPIRLSGWAAPARFNLSRIAWPELKLVLGGEHRAYAFNAGLSRTVRPDVALALKNPRFDQSGFDAFIDPRDVETGTYRIILASSSGTYCDTGHRVEITHPSRPFSRF